MLDEHGLIEALNSTPVVDGSMRDLWADDGELRQWVRAHGGAGRDAELGPLRTARARLQAVVAGDADPDVLAELLVDTRQVARIDGDGIGWVLETDPDRRPAIELILAWASVQQHLPGRLRPCANAECRLFLLDRSRANTARWCSMKVCGNRLKARRHQQRRRPDRAPSE